MQKKIEGILSEVFDIPMIQFEYGMVHSELLEYYCFLLIQRIREDDDLDRFPHLRQESSGYSDEFVNYKVSQCSDIKAVEHAEFKINVMAAYLGDNRQLVMSNIFWVAHKQLMIRDFGAMFDLLGSDCRGITKEAEKFQGESEG